MKLINYLILTALFLSFLLTLPAPVTYACDCVVSGSPSEEMEKKDAVFSGKVLTIKDRNKLSTIKSSADPMEVVIAVNEIWKGIEESQVAVFTERDSASCGFEFQVGQEYLVYASKDGDQLRASLCSRTALLSLASDDVTELGAGEKPTINVVIGAEEKNQSSSTNWFIVTGGFIILAVAGYYFLRKRKS